MMKRVEINDNEQNMNRSMREKKLNGQLNPLGNVISDIIY